MYFRPLETLELKPHALGRYVIEFPIDAMLLNWSQSLQGIGPIRIRRNVSPVEFEDIVKKRADEFRLISHEKGGTRLDKVVTHRIPQCKSVLYWDDDWSEKGPLVEADDYFLKDGVLYESSGAIRSDPAEQEAYLQRYQRNILALRARKPDEIPSEPGCCIDGAILLDGPDREYFEIVMASVFWPERPDVRFHFTVYGNSFHPDPPLLARLKAADAIPKTGVLRSRARTIGENQGEEHLEVVVEKNGTVGHLFHWEAQGLPNRFDYPQLVVTMSTGRGKNGPVNASLSDEDALKLWDAILDSLRWRPTIPPTGPNPDLMPWWKRRSSQR